MFSTLSNALISRVTKSENSGQDLVDKSCWVHPLRNYLSPSTLLEDIRGEEGRA